MNTIFRSILLLFLISFSLTAYSQFLEKANMSFRNAHFDIFIIKIDSSLSGKVSFAENINMSSEERYFSSIEQATNSTFFAITASIVDTACRPLGFYVSNRNKIKSVNLDNGTGNFFIKPNGIFAITSNKEFVITDALKFDTTENSTTAIQSGPMLISNGIINPAFDKNSKNKHIRCAIGMYTDKGSRFLIFVKSTEPVSFFQLAQLLQEKFNCLDALSLESGDNCSMHPVVIPKKYDDRKRVCRYLLINF